jgi:hypothetical protein
MNSRKIKIIIKSFVVLLSLVLFGLSYLTFAAIRVTTPTFPSCTNPQGLIKVSYKSGTHGIPGNYSTFTGEDTVYTLSEDTLTQCFCSEDEKGIQTNWWKVSSLNTDEIDYLSNLGWIYIPNGFDWGLEESPYMAKNSSFSCQEDKDGGSDDSDDDSDNDGEVLGAQLGAGTWVGNVLGLASTGDAPIVWALGISALLFTIAGVFTLVKNKR